MPFNQVRFTVIINRLGFLPERDYTNVTIRYVRVFAIANPSVCLSVCVSVCNVGAPYSGVTCSATFLRHCVPWPFFDLRENCTNIVIGELSVGAVNASKVAN